MAYPRRSFSRNHQNAVWLMNAASLSIAIGTVGTVGTDVVSFVPEAKAAVMTWTGLGTDNNIQTATNWSTYFPGNGGLNPSNTLATTGDTQLFDGTGTVRNTISVGSNRFMGLITIGAYSSSTAYTFTTFGATVLTFQVNSASTNQTVFTNNFTNGAVTFSSTLQVVNGANDGNIWTGVSGSTTNFNGIFASYNSAAGGSGGALGRGPKIQGEGNWSFAKIVGTPSGTQPGVPATASATTGFQTFAIENTGTTILSGANTLGGILTINQGTSSNNPTGGITRLQGDNSGTGFNLAAFDAAVTNTHAIKITRGTVLLENNLALGTRSQVVGNSTTVSTDIVKLLTNGAYTIANNLFLGQTTGASGANYTIGGNADANSTFSGSVTLNKNSTISQAATTGNNKLTISGAISGAAAGRVLTFDGAGAMEISGAIGSNLAIAAGSTSTSSTRVVTLSGNNTFVDGVTINSGVLAIGSAGALNSTAPNAITWGASTSNGTLRLNGNSAVVKSLTTNATPGTPIIENGNASNGTLIIGNASNADSTFAGVIRDGSGGGVLGINVAGTGTLTLSGANTYTGDTNIVSGGKLRLTGSLASGNTVNIVSGGTLYGTGSANGTVKIAGSVNPGSAGVGTFTTGATDLQAGGTLNIQFYSASGAAGSTGWDLLSTGALTTSATSGSKFNINLISISSVGADTTGNAAVFNNTLNNQTFEIIRASSLAAPFDVSNFNLIPVFTNSLNGGQWTLTSSNNSIYATFIIPTSLYWSAGSWSPTAPGAGGAGSWADGSGSWDSAQTAIFSGSTGGLVSVGTVTSASGITFATTGYTLEGGTITLSGGSATVNSITTDAGINAVISSSLNGTNGLFKSGTGTLTLSGDNSSLSGGITIISGTLVVGNNNALGVSASPVSVSSGAVLDLFGATVTNTNALSIAGTGALVNTGADASYAGNITLTAATSIISTTGGIALGGNISGIGNLTMTVGAGSITVNGSVNTVGNITINPESTGNTSLMGNIGSNVTGLTYGTNNTTGTATTLLLSGANSYTGTVTINAGTVKLGSSTAFGNSANSVVAGGWANGVAIDLNGQSTPNAISIYGTGVSNSGIIYNSSANPATASGTITVNNTSTIAATAGDITFSGAIKTSSSTNRTITFIGNHATQTNIYVNSGVLGGASSTGFFQLVVGQDAVSNVSDKIKVTLAGTQILQTNGNVRIKGGTLVLASSSTLQSSGMSLNAGGSTSDNSTLLLTAANDYTWSSLGIGGNLTFDTTNAASPTTITFTAGGNASTNANFGQTGSSSKQLNAREGVTVVIGSAGQSTFFDLVGTTGTSPSIKILKLDGAGNFTINSVLRENKLGAATASGGINKIGAGILNLNAANTYTGGTELRGGITKLGNAAALGDSTSTVRVDTGATLDLNGQTIVNTNALNLNSGTITNTSTTKATYAGLVTAGGNGATITADAGDIDITNVGTIGLTTGTGFNLTLNGANGGTITSIIGIGTGALNKAGAGNWILNGAGATYTGDTNISGGILTLGTSGAIGSGAITITNNASLALGINNHTASQVTLTSGNITGSGTLTSITDFNVVSGTVSANLAGEVGLNKTGAGMVTISSPQTYTGATVVNNGVLKISDSLATSSITIASGAKLEGQATVNAPVSVANNGIITSGDSLLGVDTRGSLTVSQITFLGNAEIKLANINSGGLASILNAGTVSAQGGVGSFITFNIDNTLPLDNNVSYTLLDYDSLDDFSVFKLGTVGGTYSRQILNIENDIASTSIILTTSGDTIKWKGDTLSTPLWTTSTGNLNWKLSSSGASDDYLLGDVVSFDDTAESFIVTIAEDVSPNGLTFDNNLTNTYTVDSAPSTSFGIEGTASLIKNGTGRVDLNAPISISGGLTINNGTLALNNSGNTFTGNITLAGAAILELGASGALGTSNSLTFGAGATGKLSLNGNNATLTGLSNNTGNVGTPIVENGSATTNSTLTLNIGTGITNTFDGLLQNGSTNALLLTKTGSGTLVLTSDNTFTGLTTVTNGTIQLGNNGTTGSVGGDILIDTTGTLELTRTNKLIYSNILSGTGTINLNSGELELLGANTFSGSINIDSTSTLKVGSSGSISSSIVITNDGTFEYANSSSAYSLGTITGGGSLSVLANTVTQTGTNSLLGSLNIGSGSTYAIATNGSFTSMSSLVNDGTLSFGSRATDYTMSLGMSGLGNLVSNLGIGRTLYLTGDNTYTGTTTVSSGILNVGNNGSTGSLGTGGLTISANAALVIAKSAPITLTGTISGAGNITLAGAGGVTLDANSPIDITGELIFGSTAGSTTHSSLDLSNSSATVGKLTVQTDATNNLSALNTIIIGADKSLNVKGLVTIGLNNGSNPTTNLTMTGDGAFNIGTLASPTNLNVNVGASVTDGRINYVNWDMSALATLNMYLGTGTFNVGGDTNLTGGGGTGNGVTVKLPTTSTIVATTLLMDAPQSSKIFTLSLGSGINTLNVDTLTVGGLNTRGTNILNFNSGNGSLELRSMSGGRAVLNIQSSTKSSSNNFTSSVDFSGHSADLLLSTVTVGRRVTTGSTTGYGSGYLAFDTGIFDATTLNIANKSHNGTQVGTLSGKTGLSTISGNLIGLVSFGGGTVNIGTVDLARHGVSNAGGTAQGLMEFLGSNTSTIGAVTMASAASALVSGTPDVTGIINIADGAVSIASISGASAALNTIATARLNLSGGTLTMGGNITRTGGLGTSIFDINLSGGTLDMGGNSIGTTGSNINFNWTYGTLQNVSGLNGNVGITIDSGDQSIPVYLAGTNTFTGKITIKDSILELASSNALGANSKIGFDGTQGILKMGTGITTDVSTNLSSGDAQFDTNGNDVIFNSPVSGLTSFTKLNGGKLTLSSTSGSLAPIVSIFGGTLELGDGTNIIPPGGFLNGTTTLNLDALGGSPELIANGVKVDLDAVVNLINSGATISGNKGTFSYSFNFLKDIIAQDGSTATISATDMITGPNAHINVGSGAVLTISGSFIDNTDTQQATQITKNGTGTLELTGTGNAYSGATTVNAGTLAVSQGALNNSSTAITVNDTAILTATDLGTNVSITVASGGTADISGTDLTVKDITTENSTVDAFIFSGTGGKITAESLSGSGSITFASDALEVATLDGAGSIVFSGGLSTITAGSGTFSGSISGATSFIKEGSGTLTISGTNALTGIVTLNDGILSLADLASLSAPSELPENLVFQGGNLEYTGTVATMTRGFTVGDGGAGFMASGSDALTIAGDMDFADVSASNRTLSLGGTSDIAIENIYNPNKIDAADVTNLFTKLVKQDTNKWIVLGAGAGFVDDAQTEIDIQNGELGFAMGALGSSSTINVGALGLGATATLGWVNGNTEDVSARVNLKNAASAAFNIPSGNTVTFASALNGGVSSTTSLTKTGGGTLNLDASNSFSGGFTISGGIVKAGVAGSVGTGSVTVNSSSTLVVNAPISNVITINSGGTLTSDNSNQDINDTTVFSGGTLVPGGNVIGTMTVNNLTLRGGSIVNWQLSNAAGAANNNHDLAGTGYDTFILNSLLLTDASLNPITIRVMSLSGAPAQNFDQGSVQSFQFAKLTTKLSQGYNVTSLFEIDASEFEFINGIETDQLVWRMTLSADREYLYVVAIPEPSTYGLVLGALALAAAAVRRRKNKNKSPAV